LDGWESTSQSSRSLAAFHSTFTQTSVSGLMMKTGHQNTYWRRIDKVSPREGQPDEDGKVGIRRHGGISCRAGRSAAWRDYSVLGNLLCSRVTCLL
jgi:hypothetical protein